MQKLPEEGEPLPPLIEAFQQLKFDPNENTTEGLLHCNLGQYFIF